MNEIFLVVYYGLNNDIPNYLTFRSKESAVNFTLKEYEKEYSDLVKDFPPKYKIYLTPKEARKQFNKYCGIPNFADVVVVELQD